MFFTPERIFLLCCLGGGYIFGLIQTAFFISKAKHKDLRYHGSGNLGTTNAWRVLGAGYGILTFIGDIVKTAVAIFLAMYIYQKFFMTSLSIDFHAVVLYSGVGVVLGHDFPVYLKFKGGKGIACTFATIACLQDLKLLAVAVFVFLVVFLVSRYVSVASLLMVFCSAVAFMFFMLMKWTYVPNEWVMDCEVMLTVLFILAMVAHRTNLLRLAYDEENKFLFRKRLRQEQQEEDYTDFDKYYDEAVETTENVEAPVEAEEAETAIEEATAEEAEEVEATVEEEATEVSEAVEEAEVAVEEEVAEAIEAVEAAEEEEVTEVTEAPEAVEAAEETEPVKVAEEEEPKEKMPAVQTSKNKSGKKNKSSKKSNPNKVDKRKQRRLDKKAKRENQKNK